MASLTAPLILASQSPRRHEILSRLGIPFRVEVSQVDESLLKPAPGRDFCVHAAEAKARDIASRQSESCFVLGADTVVTVDSLSLGKPVDDEEATVMIRRLSGRWHAVWTGVFVVAHPNGDAVPLAVETRVRFRELTDAEIAGYVATGEGRDKAGAYGIQGIGGGLVERIEGAYDNVVGLPGTATLELLAQVGALRSWP